MRISIITVTYNAGEVLERTMRSVAAQSFRDYEHIIVDGASTDDTLAIASNFSDSAVDRDKVVIHSQKDNGIYHGMNRGLKYAKGDYVIFLNAGDTFASEETLASYAAMTEKGYDIIYGDTVIVNDEGKFLRRRHLEAPRILTKDSFKTGMLICHQAFMMRRALAPKYSKDYRLSADYDWTIRCIAATDPSKCVNLERVTINYLDNGATEKHKLESLKERFVIMCRHYGVGGTIARHFGFALRALKRKCGIR